MSRKLRIFVSSTMKDLANEREAVCRLLQEFNFEPVNAENLGPTGAGSWERIQTEIASSDLLVLLLGDRYGWIPDAGPKADQKMSVTDLEADEAQRLGIPILPFLKRLDDDADRTSEDAKRRDAFRKKIKDWDGGRFVQSFDLASDLAKKVGRAVVDLLSDGYQKQRIQARAPEVHRFTELLPKPDTPGPAPSKLALPPELTEVVRRKDAVLFAGAGVSLAAGMPSAAAFAERLTALIGDADPASRMAPTKAFADAAMDVVAFHGRAYVTQKVRELMEPPQNSAPTLAHRSAVRLFPRIITTNFDGLFEDAARSLGVAKALVTTEIADSQLPNDAIVKLHGSYDLPDSLLITETDVLMLDRKRPRLCRAILDLMRTKTLIAVGSSFRDPSIVRLFEQLHEEIGDRPMGYVVAPAFSLSSQIRLTRWGFSCLVASSDEFFSALEEAVAHPA